MKTSTFSSIEEFNKRYLCDYDIIIGRGGFGEIYEGLDTLNNEKVAIKRCSYNTSSQITLEAENSHTQNLPPHPNVIRYNDYARFKITGVGYFEYLVMKFYPDGNLSNLAWNQLNETQQSEFLIEFLDGLEHLHKNRIIHRDVKPNNILVFKYSHGGNIHYRPIITDFGLSRAINDGEQDSRSFVDNDLTAGAISFMAPEQLNVNEKISYSADLWSFGIILYQLVCNKTIVAKTTDATQHRERVYAFWSDIKNSKYPPEVENLQPIFKEIIKKCLVYDSTLRFRRASEIINLLKKNPIIEVRKPGDGDIIWVLDGHTNGNGITEQDFIQPDNLKKQVPVPPQPTPPIYDPFAQSSPQNPNATRIKNETILLSIFWVFSLVLALAYGMITEKKRYSPYGNLPIDSRTIDTTAAAVVDTAAVYKYADSDSVASRNEENSVSGYGDFIVWTRRLDSEFISVYIDEEYIGEIQNTKKNVPNCSSTDCVKINKKAGNYNLRAISPKKGLEWTKTITIYNSDCGSLELTYSE